MADEMKISRDPNVNIDFEVPSRMIILTISNSGLTSAVNVQFDIDSDISWLNFDDNKGFSKLPIIIEGISYLTPGRILKFYAGNLDKSSSEREQNVLDLNILYQNESGKKFKKHVTFDLSVYRKVLFETFKH